MFWETLKKRNKEKRNSPDLWIIAGLGNFGPEYEGTRHNCGFSALESLCRKLNAGPEKHKFKGVYREASVDGSKIILLKPYTYMNNSGESISEAMNWYKIKENRLIVIYDDTDIGLGEIRVRPKGSAGSHNGMKSVLQYTDSDEFVRIRVGIGKRPEKFDMVDFVLGHFTDEEKPLMNDAFDRAGEAALFVIKEGCEKAMGRYNGKAGGNPEKKQ